MKPHIPEYGSFNQPQPGEDNESHDIYFSGRKSPTGSQSSVDTLRDVREYPQFLEIARQLIRAKPYRSIVPMLSGDFQGIIDKQGEYIYVDALLSARRHFFRKSQKKRGAFQEKHTYLIHTVAAPSVLADSAVDIENIKLHSKDDVSGYYVTANDGAQTIGFFIETRDRELVRKVHNEVVKLCSSGEKPMDPHEALRTVFERSTKESSSHSIDSARFIWRGDFRFTLRAGSDEHIVFSHDELVDEKMPLSWEDRAEAFVECKKIARISSDVKKGNSDSKLLTHSFHGYLPPGRVGDPNRRFVDETISGYPGGIFVYTRAFGSGEEDRVLSSRADILKYRCSVGLKGAEKTIEIETVNRNLANEIHLWILNELRQSDDMRLRQDPLSVLKKAMNEFMTPDNPDKEVLITIV